MSEKHKKNYPFPLRRKEDESFTLLKKWWKELETNKGDRAALRRAASLTEVMFVPSFHLLLNKFRREYEISDFYLAKLAATAGLVARVKDDVGGTLGEKLGSPKSGDKPLLSELRMRRILACDDLDELYTLLRRAISVADDAVSVSALAVTVWHWMPLTEKHPDDSRRQLALDYYAAAPL